MPALTPDWLADLASSRGGAVLVGPPGVAEVMAVRMFAADQAAAMTRLVGRTQTFPLRIPHHSVTPAGLVSDLPFARSGAMVLEDLQEIAPDVVETLALAPIWKRREVVVFGFSHMDPKDAAYSANAHAAAERAAQALGLPLFVSDDATSEYVEQHVAGVFATPTAPDVLSDLAVINAHRRQIHMAPLDPAAAGWTDDDVRTEAARLRGNPALDARADLLSWSPA